MGRVARTFKWIGILLIVVITAVVGYSLLRDKVTGPPPSAANLSDMRSLNTALSTYKSAYGRYPDSLLDLGMPDRGPSTEHGAGLVGVRLAQGHAHAYQYSYERTDRGYVIHADPERSGEGVHLYSDQTAEIRTERSGPAGPKSDPLK